MDVEKFVPPGELETTAQLVLDSAPVLVWISDATGGTTYFNQAWLEFTGRSLEEELGEGWAENVHPDDRDHCLTIYGKSLEARRAFEMEYRLRRADGEFRWVVDRAVPRYDEQGTFLGFIGCCADITERMAAGQLAEQAELRLERIVDTALDAIIAIDDIDHRITLFNRGAERTFGCRSKEAIGRHIGDFIPHSLRGNHDQHIKDFASSGVPERQMSPREIRGLRASGEEFPAEARISQADVAGRKIFTVILRDISERKRVEDSLRFLADTSAVLAESLDFTETLHTIARKSIETFADWCTIHYVDDHGRLQRAAAVHRNPAKEEYALELQSEGVDLTPIERVLATGKPFYVAELPPETLDRYGFPDEGLRLIQNLGIHSVVIAPLVGRRDRIGTVSFIISESLRRYTEHDVAIAMEFGRRAGLAIENARLFDELRRANAVKDEFLGFVSHELRNPLTSITGLSTALLRQADSMDAAMRRETLEHLQRDASRLQVLIENLLVLARLQKGDIETEPILLNRVLPRAVNAYQQRHPGRQLELRVPEVLTLASGQEAWVMQVLENLIGNADKYSPESELIEVEVATEGEAVVVRVLDRGHGIHPDEAERVFEPFFRSATTEAIATGSGLGLAVCRRLVELQGGTIRCRTRPGGGTVFEFTMPAAVVDDEV